MTVVFWARRQKVRFSERSSSSSLLEKAFLWDLASAARISAFAMLNLVLGAICRYRVEIVVFNSIYIVSNAVITVFQVASLARSGA